jgi:hypothetical protein
MAKARTKRTADSSDFVKTESAVSLPESVEQPSALPIKVGNPVQLAILTMACTIEDMFESVVSQLSQSGIEDPVSHANEILKQSFNTAMISVHTKLGIESLKQRNKVGFKAEPIKSNNSNALLASALKRGINE